MLEEKHLHGFSPGGVMESGGVIAPFTQRSLLMNNTSTSIACFTLQLDQMLLLTERHGVSAKTRGNNNTNNTNIANYLHPEINNLN